MTRLVIYLLFFIFIYSCSSIHKKHKIKLSASQAVLKAQNDSTIKLLAENCGFVRKYVANNIKYYKDKNDNISIDLLIKSHAFYQFNDTIIGLLTNSDCFKGMTIEQVKSYFGKPSGFRFGLEYWFYDKQFGNKVPTFYLKIPKDTVIGSYISIPYLNVDY